MAQSLKTGLIYAVLAAYLGLILYIILSVSYKKRGLEIPTERTGFSIRYHYFFWLFFLPFWFLRGIDDYIKSFEVLNFFPFTLLLIFEFISVILYAISFAGFFKFTKYSWYTTTVGLFITILNNILMNIYLLIYQSSFGVNDLGRILGQFLPEGLSLIYYLKRRKLFTGKPIFLKKTPYNKYTGFEKKNLIDKEYQNRTAKRFYGDLLEDFSKNTNSTTRFCRKCGEKIDEGALFCRKCGTRVEIKSK